MLIVAPEGHGHGTAVDDAHAEKVSWLGALWENGPMAQAFVLAALVAAVALAVVLVRARVRYGIHAGVFLTQIRKLVEAGNIDRAIKLTHAADYPVLVVSRAGLQAARGGPGAARAAMDAVRDAACADGTRGFLAARVLASVAVGLGVSVAVRYPESAVSAGAITCVIAFSAFMTWQLARMQAGTIAYVAQAIEEIAGR